MKNYFLHKDSTTMGKKYITILLLLLFFIMSSCSETEESSDDEDPPSTSASIESGLYSPQTVKLGCSDAGDSGCLATYYTIDGTTPNRASTPYSGPIAIWSSTTLKFFSIDHVGNTEGVQTKEYTIGTIVLEDVQSFSSGWDHSTAIKNDGTLWAWGGNSSGQLGTDSTNDSTIPLQIGTGNQWKMADAGKFYTLAIRNDGTLWAWGLNNQGQLGNDSTSDSLTPVQIGTDWEQISTGRSHALGIKTDGTLWAWGANDKGQVGNDSSIDALTPVQIGSDTNWQAASAGLEHSAALKDDGMMWTWGGNTYGQLGIGTETVEYTPQLVAETNWSSLSSGDYHILAMKIDGTIWAWGQNWYGQLGNNRNVTKAWAGDGTHRIARSITYDKSYPFKIGTYDDWIAVAAGGGHSLGIKKDGRLWTWGLNVNGQLADGTIMDNLLPLPVGPELSSPNIQPKHPWVKISAGSHQSFALRNDSTLWSWGWNGSGQLGNGSTVSTNGGSNKSTATWRIPKFSYVISDEIYSYDVNYTTGMLTSIGDSVETGTNPIAAVMHRSNEIFYVLDRINSNSAPSYIHTFSINRNTGIITQVGVAKETLINAESIFIDPQGRFVYVKGSNMRGFGFKQIAVYTIDPVTGELTCVGNSVNGVETMAFDPLGRFAYVIKQGTFLTYKIDQTTGLLPDVWDNDNDEDDQGESMTASKLDVDRSGQYLFATRSSNFDVYEINQTNGSIFDTGLTQGSGASINTDFVIGESNFYLYVLYSPDAEMNLNFLKINQLTGQITEEGQEGAENAIGVKNDPTGKLVYVFTQDSVIGYGISPIDGRPTAIGGAGSPTEMATDSSAEGGTIKTILFASF